MDASPPPEQLGSYFECIVFIANESIDSRIFSKMSISRALCSLGYTRKVTSTVAYQALTERNLLRRRIFWDEPWPVGVNGFPRQHLIDADKFGLHLNAANSKYGLAPWGMRIRKPGNYEGLLQAHNYSGCGGWGSRHCSWSAWTFLQNEVPPRKRTHNKNEDNTLKD